MSTFIAPTAIVGDNVHVRGNAQIYDRAKVGGNAIVSGNAKVGGNAWVGGHAILERDVTISSGWVRNVHWWKEIP